MRRQKEGSPVQSVILGNLMTALICLPFMIGRLPSAPNTTGLAFMGIFQLGLSYLLYSKAIQQVRAVEASLIPILEALGLNPLAGC